MNTIKNSKIAHFDDKTTTLFELKELLEKFVTERDWVKFHTPKNLIMALSVEVAELMEKFQWVSEEKTPEIIQKNRQAIEDEVADVMSYLVRFATVCNINIAQAVEQKMAQNRKKYPVEKIDGTLENVFNLKKEFKDNNHE